MGFSEKTRLSQFIVKDFEYLTNTKFVEYKGIKLKSDYLINLINEFIVKYLFNDTKELRFNIWSLILRKTYGANYNYYIDYLIEKKFITLVSNYYVSKKAKTYQLNYDNLLDIRRCKIYDKFIIRKHEKEYLINSKIEYNNSSIPLDIRHKLVENIFKVKLDYDKSLEYLNNIKDKLEKSKYLKNIMSIDSLKEGYLFFKFDEYGRFHSNFTILKKDIRNNFLKLENKNILDVDIKNSQPLFLSILMKKEISDVSDDEFQRYFWLVNNGLFYDDFISKFPDKFKSRTEVKLTIYKVFFGKNHHNSDYNRMFRKIYPKIYNYIKEYKEINESHKTLSHTLQRIESDFIYGKVVKEIIEKYPEMVFFTVHDSIYFPENKENEIKEIFEKHLNELKNNI